MNTKHIREAYYEYTDKLSQNTRNLSLAGIGIVWVFKVEQSGVSYLPHALLVPAIFFVGSVAMDFFQYGYAAIAFGMLTVLRDRTHQPGDDISIPRLMNVPTLLFFYGKILLAVGGYVFLLRFVLSRFTAS